jgi:hypothetical protein
VDTYIDNSLAGQASPGPKSSENLIEQYRASERGDYRAIAALATISQELAEADVNDCGWVDLCAISAERQANRPLFYRTPPSGGPSPARTWALIARMRAARTARVAKVARRRRAGRSGARQVRSPAAHGGARKAGDDGGGEGVDGPDPNFPDAVYWRKDGEAMWRGKPLFAPLPKPRRGYRFVNANCECWRRQFSNLFCAKCVPVDRREVPIPGSGTGAGGDGS